jgi:hypothetical protein
MQTALHQIPFFENLSSSQNIFLVGAGGGFDIYNGIPIFLNLIQQGKNVVLGNLSFTDLEDTNAECIMEACYRVTSQSENKSWRNYFPEKYLCEWLEEQNVTPVLYAFEKPGVQPLLAAYNHIITAHHIDTIILIDGGTDSLMFGDEEGLGTPVEDITSMAAAHQCNATKKYLVSVGFGIDHFHGVSHYRFLENMTTIMRDKGYLGLFQMTKEMQETQGFLDLVAYANAKMAEYQSIVANSVASAAEGHYGNFHRTDRTENSVLYINPLMTIFWCFELAAVINRITYYDLIKNSKKMSSLQATLAQYRRALPKKRTNRPIPL